MPRPTPQRMLPTPPAYSSLAPWSPGVALPFLFLLPSAPFRPPAAAPSFPDRESSARIACSNSSGRLARARPRRAAASRRAQTMRQRPSNAAAYATGRSGTSQETASAAGSAAAAAASMSASRRERASSRDDTLTTRTSRSRVFAATVSAITAGARKFVAHVASQPSADASSGARITPALLSSSLKPSAPPSRNALASPANRFTDPRSRQSSGASLACPPRRVMPSTTRCPRSAFRQPRRSETEECCEKARVSSSPTPLVAPVMTMRASPADVAAAMSSERRRLAALARFMRCTAM
mmetsp:Transcript_40638/g.132037  ORF Transcript_40638/g.132037 Transcript_40638/m.132037 type:complete len:296 (-) Transcript_40638:161-1048(-)